MTANSTNKPLIITKDEKGNIIIALQALALSEMNVSSTHHLILEALPKALPKSGDTLQNFVTRKGTAVTLHVSIADDLIKDYGTQLANLIIAIDKGLRKHHHESKLSVISDNDGVTNMLKRLGLRCLIGDQSLAAPPPG